VPGRMDDCHGPSIAPPAHPATETRTCVRTLAQAKLAAIGSG
jgi:hypothetical protein